MPSFAYHAIDRDARRHRGVREGPTASAITRSLEESGWLVLHCEEMQETVPRGLLVFRRRAVLTFARALASLVGSGLPLARAITTAEHVTPLGFKYVLRDLRARLDRGDSLSNGLRAHSRLFSPVFVGIVAAGERSGDLAGALDRLAQHMEREAEFRSRMLSATTYPLLLTVTGTVAMTILFVVVLPRFVDLLEGVGASLPRSTLLLLGLAHIARRLTPYAPAIVLALLVAAIAVMSLSAGRNLAARAILGIPVLGNIRRNALAGRFARTMAVLLDGGAPVLSSLEHAARSIADPLARLELERMRERVREGGTLASAMAEDAFFPPLLVQLVGVGEQSSKLHEFFLRSAELYERETQRALERLVTIAEPALVVGFGLVIGFVALALFQAIYGVNAGIMR